MAKVYGPYTRPDGRKHVIIYDGQTRRTVSYPRYLMENHLGRKLTDNETVDHINNDFTDDRLENLQVLTRTANIRKSAKKAVYLRCICPNCNQSFIVSARQVKHNQLTNEKDGPFCSKSCAASYTYSNPWNK